jgi:hypothetical protein
MSRPEVRIHNTKTDEIVDREMNDAEFAQYQKDQAAFLAEEAEVKAKTEAKANIAKRLGLSVDELATLLG